MATNWKALTEEAVHESRNKGESLDNFAPMKPFYPEPVKKDYPQTEMHYIICVDADKANISKPEAAEKYGSPHVFGAYLACDMLHTPDGWMKAPKKGTPVLAVKDSHPDLYNLFVEKGINNF